MESDFSVEVTLYATFEALYDQLGVMVRVDDEHWLKTGLEYSDGCAQLSTVLTRSGWSDWSTAAVSNEEVDAGIRIRLTRHGDVVPRSKAVSERGVTLDATRLSRPACDHTGWAYVLLSGTGRFPRCFQ